MNTTDLIAYYVNLLVIQYKALPRATATIRALAAEVVANQIFSQVLNGFDLDTAVGEQLDILAEYVGAPRQIFGYDPTIPYWALYSYNTTPPSNVGFASYADATDPVDNWLSYTSSETSFVLTDGMLRQLIKYMIAVHASDHTIASIDLILQQFFGQYVVLTDNGSLIIGFEQMTITYTHQLSDPNQLFGIVSQLGLLPHPAGTNLVVEEI